MGPRTSALLCAIFLAVGVTVVGPARAEATAQRKVSAWLPYWDQARGYQSFLDNAELFAEVSPFWYEMASTTSVQPYWNAEDQSIVDGIKAKGVLVVPTVSNNFDPARVSTMLSSATNRTAHVRTLVDLVKAKGYDGIDVDYENLYAADRDRFSAFIGELADSLHASGRKLTVAVHPKTSEPGSWSGPQAQDYKAIGTKADRLRVMAYDYHWATSSAGPIAPLPWVRDVAAFAASQVSPSKVQLGMPLYGYDWVGTNGVGKTHGENMSTMSTYKASRKWSSTDAAPWFTYSADGKSHEVWYEDAESVKAKLPVVDELGLGGAVLWRLGGEDPAAWTEMSNRWGGTSTTQPTTTTERHVFTGSVSGKKGSTHGFQVAAPKTIDVSLDWSTTSANLDLLLKDPGGRTVAKARTSSRPERLSFTASTSGTWKIVVKAASGGSSYEAVVNVSSGSTTTTTTAVSDTLEFVGSVDSGGTRTAKHKFSLPAPGTIGVVLDWTTTSANLDLLLKDPSGKTVAKATTSSRPETLTFTTSTTGTWTVVVRAASGASAYTALVTLS